MDGGSWRRLPWNCHVSQKIPNLQLHVNLIHPNKKFKKKIPNRSYPATDMGRRYVGARRRGARVFRSVLELMATPGPSLFMNLEEEGNLGSC